MTTTIDLWSDLAQVLDHNERIEAPSIPLERITHAVIGRGSDNVGYLELTLEDGTVLVFSRAGMTRTEPRPYKTLVLRKGMKVINFDVEKERSLSTVRHFAKKLGYEEIDTNPKDWFEWAEQGGTMTDDQWRNFLRNEFKDEEEK